MSFLPPRKQGEQLRPVQLTCQPPPRLSPSAILFRGDESVQVALVDRYRRHVLPQTEGDLAFLQRQAEVRAEVCLPFAWCEQPDEAEKEELLHRRVLRLLQRVSVF